MLFSSLWALAAYAVSSLAAPTVMPAASSFYVPNIPNLSIDPSQPPLHVWSGHLLSEPNVSEPPSKDVLSHLFFMLIKARRSADKERVIFWLNGGPGCSSFDGVMMEVGPWRVDGKGGLKMVSGGWDEYSNIVFVDQPAGTGLSYASTDRYLKDLTEVQAHFVQFMKNFYQVFPELKTADTYLAGESYAGQYIPYIADGILKSNLGIVLAGAAIGNGWIDGRTQYPAYIEYGLKTGLLKEGSEAHQKSKDLLADCLKQMDAATLEPTSIDVCERIMGTVTSDRNSEVNGQRMCLNVYDIRLTDTYPACGMNWPPDLPDVTTYLGRKDVVSALHATGKQEAWQECSGQVGAALTNKNSASSITILPSVLSQIPVMLFAGDQDMICNYVGQERLIEALEWNGAKGMNGAETVDWSVAGKPAGTWQSSRNLTYVKVFGASHMVGFDVPDVAHDMMLRFMNVDPTKIAESDSDGADGEHQPTPAEIKAKWDAYYNAGTATLVVVLIALGIGLFFYCRTKRNARPRGDGGAFRDLNGDAEESIPLTRSQAEIDESRRRKGKGRATLDDIEGRGSDDDRTMFEIGSDGEERYAS